MSIEYDAANLVKTIVEADAQVVLIGAEFVLDTEDSGSHTGPHGILTPTSVSLSRYSSDQMSGEVSIMIDFFIPPTTASKESSITEAWEVLDSIRKTIVNNSDVRVTAINTDRPVRIDGSVDLDGWFVFTVEVTILAGLARSV